MGKSSKDRRDIHYRLAKEQGYRARSAYKLKSIDSHFHIFTPETRTVLDLCAAPGSWAQVIRQSTCPSTKILGVDIQPISPLDGVDFIQADITSPETLHDILHRLGGSATLVVCDGAPDVTGVHALDISLQSQLLTSALTMAAASLCRSGTFIAKLFTYSERDVTLLRQQCQSLFQHVVVMKPESSRASSLEHFIVCREFNPPSDFVKVRSIEPDKKDAFMAFGDLSMYD